MINFPVGLSILNTFVKEVLYMQENNADRLKKFYKWWLPMYNIINKKMCTYYREAMPTLLRKIAITGKTTVLDIGTGTGGFA